MAIEVPKNEEISGRGKDGRRKGVGSSICWRGANRGGIHIEKRERGRVVKRDVDPFIMRVWIKQRKRGGRKFRKDRPCLTKMTMPPLACVVSEERMPDRELVRSERRADNPGIQKEEEELRLDS